MGCANTGLQDRKSDKVLPAAANQTPHPATPGGRPTVPEVFTGRFSPKPLTREQKDRVLGEAEALAPPGRVVWFIRVHRNTLQDTRDDLNVSVYFTPHEESHRIRKGRFVRFDSFRKALWGQLGLQPSGRLSSYCQVSLADHPFDGELMTPTVRLLPFRSPDSLNDQEIIEIVDYVRTNPVRESRRPRLYNGESPIVEIRRSGDAFDVRLGWSEGFLSGMGQFLRCVRTEDGFKVESHGQWVS